jgi:hypothetical protein
VKNKGEITIDDFLKVIERYKSNFTIEQIENMMIKIRQQNIKDNFEKQIYINYTEFIASTINMQKYLTKERLWCLYKQISCGNNVLGKEEIKLFFKKQGVEIPD